MVGVGCGGLGVGVPFDKLRASGVMRRVMEMRRGSRFCIGSSLCAANGAQ